jgi:MFS family permease
MVLRLTPIAPVLLGVSLAQIALGLMTTLIPLLLLRDGVATPVIGFIASAYFAGFLAGSLSAAGIVASVGHIRAFAVFAAVAAMTAQVMVFAIDPWVVGFTRLVMGYASSGLFLVAESWINDRADSATRGRYFGAYQVVNWGATAFGPLMLRLVAPQASLFAFVGAAFAASLLPMALTLQPNPEIRQGRRLGLRQLFQISPVGVVCCLASGLLNSAFYALMPVYLGKAGLDAAAISTFASAVMIAALVVQYPLGMIADMVERRKLTLLVLGVCLAGALGMMFTAGGNLLVLGVFGCLMAGAMSPLYGLGAGQTNDRLERGDYVAAAGGLLFTWSVGAAIGPSLAGALMGQFGAVGLFIYLVTALVLLAVFVILRMLRRGEVPREAQSAFVPAGAAPPRLAELANFTPPRRGEGSR